MSRYEVARLKVVDLLSWYRIDPSRVLLDGLDEFGYFDREEGWTKWHGLLPSDARRIARLAELMERSG